MTHKKSNTERALAGMKDSEYFEAFENYYLDKELVNYYESIKIIFKDLQKNTLLELVSIELSHGYFFVTIKSDNSDKIIFERLYESIDIMRYSIAYTFLYHHPTEVLDKIKLENLNSCV